MKKLKLKLDDLKIDSFQTSAKVEKKGTVAGNELSLNICPETVFDCPTDACPTNDGSLNCSSECTYKTCFCI